MGGAVFFFEEFFGAGFGIGEIVKGVLFDVFAGGGVVDIDGGVAFFFEGGLFGTSGTWCVGAIED